MAVTRWSIIQKVSPVTFLNKGFISENFNLSRNIPVDRILLPIKVKGHKMYGALAFRILVYILSYPCEFFGFKSLIISSILFVVVCFNLMFVQVE